MLRVRFSFGTGLWRWSPAMAGAIVLFGVVVANPPASIMDPTVDPPTPASIGPISSLREDVPELRTDQVSSEEVTGPLPAAVEAFLQNSAELRLGRDNYRNAVYSYPMRRIPDQVFVSDRQVYGTAGFRGAPRTLGQPVGVTVPLQGPPQGQNGVAVLTF